MRAIISSDEWAAIEGDLSGAWRGWAAGLRVTQGRHPTLGLVTVARDMHEGGRVYLIAKDFDGVTSDAIGRIGSPAPALTLQ